MESLAPLYVAVGEDGAVRLGRGRRARPDTWPLTAWAVATWFVLVIALGVGTGLLVAFSLDQSEWVAVALGGAFTVAYQRAFWLVLRTLQRRARR